MRSSAAWLFGLMICNITAADCDDGEDWRGLAGPPGDSGTSTQHDASAAATGLPCDVATVLSAHCTSCHGATPIGGAPESLLTYADLTRPSISDPSVSNVVMSLMRMQDAAAPMPPSTRGVTVPAADIAVLQAWVDAGTPRGDCAGPTDPYNTPVMCTSGTYWTRGDLGREVMHPGMACINCHSLGEGPDYPQTIAGTVYPSAHEPDDCNGTAGTSPIVVEITGLDGTVQRLTADSVGNFMSDVPVVLPYTAIVQYEGRTRAMSASQNSGDCNSCHTESGASGAPGRILLP